MRMLGCVWVWVEWELRDYTELRSNVTPSSLPFPFASTAFLFFDIYTLILFYFHTILDGLGLGDTVQRVG